MLITDLTIFKLSVPTGQQLRDPHTGELLCSTKKSWLLLKLSTDSGIVGWGEGSGEWLVPSVEACLLDWRPLLVGADPLKIAALTDDITRSFNLVRNRLDAAEAKEGASHDG